MIGLSQFAGDKFADARVHFTRAANDPEWGDGNGKETLYLFLGYTEGSLNNLAGARTNFQRALAINPEFARAQLALGKSSSRTRSASLRRVPAVHSTWPESR